MLAAFGHHEILSAESMWWWYRHAFQPEDPTMAIDQLEALPDEILAGLSPDFVASLPEDVQALIRERTKRN